MSYSFVEKEEQGTHVVSRRRFINTAVTGVITILLSKAGCHACDSLAAKPDNYYGDIVRYSELPRWYGFNLTEKQFLEYNRPYQEWDFDVISEWGFDFVRLPVDYRIWTRKEDVYDEIALQEIDQAITWARARKIHTNLCLYSVPGYSIAFPDKPQVLWEDGKRGDVARYQFASQWRMFAERYRGIPSSALSFNLVNEPPQINAAQYLKVATCAVETIRSVDPVRLIIADGKACGTLPAPELAGLKIAQSTRGYGPIALTHYKAPWIKNSDNWPVPTWPLISINQFLYGDLKRGYQSPLVLRGSFRKGSRLSIKIQNVSNQGLLKISADGVQIKEFWFRPGAGQGAWKKSFIKPEWNTYEGLYDKDYDVTLPDDAKQLEIMLDKGDWLTFSEIRIAPYTGMLGDTLIIKPSSSVWGSKQGIFVINNAGVLKSESAAKDLSVYGKDNLWNEEIEPWKRLASLGIGIHVGEWGANKFTPHDVVLAWMSDRLKMWKDVGWGWALWNLRGSCGPLDSGRSDVIYENFRGHKLDRKMLELLKSK